VIVPCCGCDRDVELGEQHVRTEDGRVSHLLCAEGRDWPGIEIVNSSADDLTVPPAPGEVAASAPPESSYFPDDGF
jgi:hypothetical protein